MGWLIGAVSVGALFLAGALGGTARVGEVINDCKTMQSFRYGDKVFDCKERYKT